MKYDNESPDGKVGFMEKGHRYEYTDTKKRIGSSVTGIIGNYHSKFDADAIAKKVSKTKTSEYYGRDPEEIKQSWIKKSEEGTELHAYGEALLQGHDPIIPDLPKAKWVPEIVNDLLEEYSLAKAELLVYSEVLDLAGQSDIILKKKWGDDEEYKYSIYDWKFLSKELQMSSYYNPYTRKYKMMEKPFHHLKDCNWIHYSIQLAIYQTLTGAPDLVKEKVLVVVNDEEYKLVPAYPMRVFWDENLTLQTVYETRNGKFYDSRDDKLHNYWPKNLVSR